jgi:hypothetical protein
MVSWGLLLGLNHASGGVAIADWSRAAQFFVYLLFSVVMGIPIGYLLLRPKLRAASFAWSIVVAACVTPVWMFAEGLYVSLTAIVPMWRQHVWAGFLLWCFLSAHFLGIRWLGYRWRFVAAGMDSG